MGSTIKSSKSLKKVALLRLREDDLHHVTTCSSFCSLQYFSPRRVAAWLRLSVSFVCLLCPSTALRRRPASLAVLLFLLLLLHPPTRSSLRHPHAIYRVSCTLCLALKLRRPICKLCVSSPSHTYGLSAQGERAGQCVGCAGVHSVSSVFSESQKERERFTEDR